MSKYFGVDIKAEPTTNSSISDSTNTFYEELQYHLTNRNIAIPSMTNISIEMQNNNQTSYNSSGNIRLRANIPANSGVPNYCEGLINGGKKIGAVESLLSFITNEDFISNVTPITNTVEETKDENGVKVTQPSPNIDIKSKLEQSVAKDRPWHMWNLNYNRLLNDNEIKKISAFFMTKFNELIDYVITNDIRRPDEKFRTYLRNMFMTSDGKTMYSFAHFTLVLPALVNYIAISSNKLSENALRYVGYVKGDSKFLPKSASKFADEVKWHKKGETMTAMTECPYLFIHNEVQQATIGPYNYPLSSNMKSKWVPSTIKLNENVDLSIVNNIKCPSITNDKYKDTNTIKTSVYMQTINGPESEPEVEIGGRLLTSSEYKGSTVIALPTCVEVKAQPARDCGQYKC